MSSTFAFQHTSYRICGISDCASLGGNPGNPRKPPETLRKPLHFCTGSPYRLLTNLSGGRSAGTNPMGHSRPPETPFILTQEPPHRVLTDDNGGRSTGTNPLAHSRPPEGLLRQTRDDDGLLGADPVVVGEVRQALPSRCKIIRMKSQDTRETHARLLPCLCVPGVFSHRTSPGASTRKSNRNRILSDSDSFILVV